MENDETQTPPTQEEAGLALTGLAEDRARVRLAATPPRWHQIGLSLCLGLAAATGAIPESLDGWRTLAAAILCLVELGLILALQRRRRIRIELTDRFPSARATVLAFN